MNKSVFSAAGFVAAAVVLNGCLAPNPVEPQQYAAPEPLTTVECLPLAVDLDHAGLSKRLNEDFDFADNTGFAMRDYTIPAETAWRQTDNSTWVVIYVVSGNGYVNVNGVDTPVSTAEACFVPAKQQLVLCNAGNAPLQITLCAQAGNDLPDALDEVALNVTSNSSFNGMCTADAQILEEARGYDNLELPDGDNYSAGQSQRNFNSQYVLGSDPDSNPGKAASGPVGKAADLNDAQTLTPAEAANVKGAIKEAGSKK